METLEMQVTNCHITVADTASLVDHQQLSSNPSIYCFVYPFKIRFIGQLVGFINDSGGHTIPAGSYRGIGLYPNAFDYELTGFLSDGTTPKALDPAKNYVDNYGFLHLQEDYWNSGDKIHVVAKWIYDDSITDSGTIELLAVQAAYGGMALNNAVEIYPYIDYTDNTTATPANGDGVVDAHGI